MSQSKVLIVEDNPEVVSLLAEVLQEAQLTTETASCGAEALEAAKKNKLDLILLDLGLPDMDGLELCRRLKCSKELMHVPVIVMTGQESVEDKVRAFEIGVVDYVNKPFQLAELQARILAHLRYKDSRDQLENAHLLEHKRTHAELNRISRAMDSTSDAVCLLEVDGRATYVNGAFSHLFRIGLERLTTAESIRGLFVKPEAWEAIQSACSAGKSWSGEVEIRTSDGEPISCLCRCDSMVGDGNGSVGTVMILTDIRQRKRLERDLLYLANHDPLTGLFNRRHFDELLEYSVAQAKRGQGSVLLYLDLDNFKVVNDSAGHPAGDRLLIEISKLLKDNTRDGDKIARFGGDEFTVLLAGASHTEALILAKRLLTLLDEFRFLEQGRHFATSVSIGLAAIDGQFSAEDVLAQADSACYMVKAKGRNGLEVFKSDSSEIQQLSREAGWSIIIKDALRENRFELWLQPIRPLRKQVNLYFEVLIRMRDRDGNLVMPGAFLPAAERFGTIQQIDYFVIERSVALLRNHSRLSLSINLSAKTLNDPGLAEFVEETLTKAGVQASRASFEITETAMIKNLNQARELILKIRGLGCRFALDDFGCGASSLSYLRDLPVDYLKIDGSFIQSIATDPINRALVKSINEVAHVLGKQTVAEYVVNSEVLKVVQELGIDYVQGYHVCAPAPPTAFFPQARGL